MVDDTDQKKIEHFLTCHTRMNVAAEGLGSPMPDVAQLRVKNNEQEAGRG